MPNWAGLSRFLDLGNRSRLLCGAHDNVPDWATSGFGLFAGDGIRIYGLAVLHAGVLYKPVLEV